MIVTSTLSEIQFQDKVDIHLIIKHQSFFVKAAADLFQEEESAVQSLINTVENVFISGLNYYHSHAGRTEMFTMAKNFGRVKIADNMTENLNNGYLLMKGGGVLAEIFGNRLGVTLNYLAAQSNVKGSSAYTYTCLYATVVLKSLGDHATREQMTVTDFTAYLADTGLGLSEKEIRVLFEQEGQSLTGENTELELGSLTGKNETESGILKSIFSFVLIAIVAVSLYFLYKNRRFEPKTSLPDSMQSIKLIGISKD